MKKLTILIFVISFLLFRPYQMEKSGMLYSGDDDSYFAHASSIVYGQFPSYQQEYYQNQGKGNPLHPIGPGLMAAPFVFVFSSIDRLMGNSIIQSRQSDNIPQSWSVYGFVLSSVFYLWLGCFLLYRGLRCHFKEYETVLAIFLMVLCQGIPLFAFRRPIFSHISEFCVISFLVWCLLLPRDQWRLRSQTWASAVTIGLVIGLLVLIRPNNILMSLIWPVILFVMNVDEQHRLGAWKRVLMAYGVAGGMVVVLQVLPDTIYHNSGNNDVVKQLLLNFHSPSFYLQRFWHVLTGIDWGLIYTAPFLLIGLGGAIFCRFPLRQAILISLLPLLVNLYVVMAWKTQGGWYGYRYLIATAMPLCVCPLALVLSKMEGRLGKGKLLVCSLIICCAPLLSMLAFEGNSQTLTLQVVKQYFGESGWGNNTYQLNVWTMLITQPVAFCIAVLKGGLLYGLVCLKMLFNIKLPFISTQEVYLNFSPILLVKTLVIYVLPFILTSISMRLWKMPK